jgi:TonB family protein
VVKIGDTIGRYALRDRLGAGGMGQVYRAFDTQLHRLVALKLLLPGADAAGDRRAWTARMIREARAAAAFSHPNAVAVYDVGEHEGQPFIVMELVEGRSLRSYVSDGGVSLAERIRWLGDMARALGAAHRAGLVHRDVKPDNVMVRDDGTIKVLDFGIARRAHREPDPTAPTAIPSLETLTTEGAVVGTPFYMSPEQLRQGPLDGRADQFAWGVVGYELLSGKRPWIATDLLSLVVAMTDETPARLRELRPEIPAPVEAAILRALSRRPEDRFATMDDAAAALEAPAAPAEVTAAPSAPAAAPEPPRSMRGPAAIAAIAAAGVAVWLLRPSAPASAPAPAPASAPASASASAPASASVSASAPVSASVSASASAPSEPPPRHPCESPPANFPCEKPLVAWCDLAEKPIACCADGLAALGEDGLCGCPPGGVKDRPGAPVTCSKKAKDAPSAEQIQAIVRVSFPAFSRCYEGALQKARTAQGRVSVTFDLTPEGRVFKARVAEASLPDPEAQACILREFRRIVFEAPTDGHRRVTYPISFSPGE